MDIKTIGNEVSSQKDIKADNDDGKYFKPDLGILPVDNAILNVKLIKTRFVYKAKTINETYGNAQIVDLALAIRDRLAVVKPVYRQKVSDVHRLRSERW